MIQRKKNQVIEAFQMTKDLDAFPKLEVKLNKNKFC
jgi:hypothetical protein